MGCYFLMTKLAITWLEFAIFWVSFVENCFVIQNASQGGKMILCFRLHSNWTNWCYLVSGVAYNLPHKNGPSQITELASVWHILASLFAKYEINETLANR